MLVLAYYSTFSIFQKVLPLLEILTQSTGSVIVKMFHYTSWNERDKIPTSTRSFLYMMGIVDEWQKSNNSRRPVCVMSKYVLTSKSLFLLHVERWKWTSSKCS